MRNLPKDISSGATTLVEELVVLPERQILEQKLIDAMAHVYGVSFIEEKEYSYDEASVA